MCSSAPSISDCMVQKSCNIIFQLGLLILELVTGQSSEMEGSDLTKWIQESGFYSSIDKMIDPDIGNNYDSTELKSLLAVAKLCIKSRDKPSFTIPQLFRYLHMKTDIWLLFVFFENHRVCWENIWHPLVWMLPRVLPLGESVSSTELMTIFKILNEEIWYTEHSSQVVGFKVIKEEMLNWKSHSS